MFSCFLAPKACRSCANIVHGTLAVSESWWDECTNKLLTPTMICDQVKQNESRKICILYTVLFVTLHWLLSLATQFKDIKEFSSGLTHFVALTMTQGGCEVWPAAHHIHYLLQRQPELEDHSLGLVGHRPLEVLVGPHEVIDQPPLMRASHNYWKIQQIIINHNYPLFCPDCCSISGGF